MLQFNHVANRIDGRHFDIIVAMFLEKLGFETLRRLDRAIWMRQPGTNIDLQLNRSVEQSRDDDKLKSQVSFLSTTPQQDLEELAIWLRERGLNAQVSAYTTREFYLDVPEAFVDFVVEAMLPELADYPIKE
ncbi:hypothetical protein OSH11_20060 [Kaistia dalseonensis]|uniref:Radical SAM superfamily enzyme YgiQ (UPF0313 family) n=1 Tax=Kaistia dalseonensis TaxID=410840 RepID=A0ABU0HBF2_9HYPH|nr:hypothetical protein [Kaistia dalseonensis]MCX5497010.1 hypothetical protein [Kaistia dalseonensis]MDQ0439636.1 radical SAM superfamily enzyme YgiQ (UPF0313 family) [Kaistia dalseonensis]